MLLFALLLALVWSAAMAAAIEGTPYGRWLAHHLTWLLVCVGVAGDLAILLLLMDATGRVVWWQAAAVLAVSGIPVSIQSLARFYCYFAEFMHDASHSARQ